MNTKYRVLIVSVLVGVLTAGGTVWAYTKDRDAHGDSYGPRERVLAHSKEQADKAVADGCEVKKTHHSLWVLGCSDVTTSKLGLEADVQVFALGERVSAQDTKANHQIGADTVQVAGNTGKGRRIAILDTGYNYTHPELSTSSSYIGGYDFVNNDSDPMDDNGHGSHVAGLIVGQGVNPNAKGVAPGAQILSGKVLDQNGSGYFSDIIEGIYWVVNGPDGVYGTADDYHVDAISMSLGTSAPYTYRGFCNSALPDLTTAIKYAVDHGVVVVSAAGNSGYSGVSIPGCISYSTTVGAVDGKDKIASFSGRGNAVDVTAPGVSLFSAWLGTSYAYASGTSMATPIVSAVVALVKSAHPAYTVSQVQNAIFKTAKDLGSFGFDSYYGWGRVNAVAAVAY